MPQYLTPGVYVEEVSTGSRPIQAVGTSVAGFVGVAPKAGAHVDELVSLTNWTEFRRAYVADGNATTDLANAVAGFFANGGRRCYVVNIGASGALAGTGRGRSGLDLLEEADDVAIVAAPGLCDAGDHDLLLGHCERLEDRVAILDSPAEVADLDRLKKVATVSTAKADEGGETTASGGGRKKTGLRPRQSDRGFGAFYYPWIVARNALDPSKFVPVPPSGHLAGIYARVDATRGVHKAPANESIVGAVSLARRVTRAEQGELNQMGVNCIRFFDRQGIRVWGARTVADGSSEWRYLNVRRLFCMIEESIKLATRWVVFEPNDRTLWSSIRRDIRAFLMNLWRDGALMGATPEEAFFVRCDEETNPQSVIDAGMVVTEIGVAPVKPAEFVVFRIGQSASGAESL